MHRGFVTRHVTDDTHRLKRTVRGGHLFFGSLRPRGGAKYSDHSQCPTIRDTSSAFAPAAIQRAKEITQRLAGLGCKPP